MGEGRTASLGVDVGGTFTDAVLVVSGRVHSAKVLSTDPQNQGVMDVILAVLGLAGLEPQEVGRFVHGTTVATNALLERRGARAVFVGTEGFSDLLAIGRQEREELYTLYPTRPTPLIPRERTLGVRERVTDGGVELGLTDAEVDRVCAAVGALAPEAVAVCLLWSFRHPEHEERLRRAFERAWPSLPVSLSSDLSPLFREYERASTVAADAYLNPRTRGYLRGLAEGCRERGLPEPEIMQSNGGTTGLDEASRHAARLLLSGPAGGVVAAVQAGRELGVQGLLSFDMGGTSTDCAAFPGLPQDSASLPTSAERVVAGVPVRLPMLDIHTVSAGGGSVAWVDEGGALKVGPQSSGARPGPASYGFGGVEATVTDAHVLLGRISAGPEQGGELRLDGSLAAAALERLAASAGLSREEAATGVVRVATFNMARALRAVTLARGIDPRGWALMAFGGAGGLHACALAEEVGIETVILPSGAGVLSALGLALSGSRVDQQETVLWRAADVDHAVWEDMWAHLEAEARERSSREAGLQRQVEARYEGQSHELTVTLQRDEGPAALVAEFHRAHEARHGYRDESAGIEIVTLRVAAALPPARPPREEAESLVVRGRQRVFVGPGWRVCPVIGLASAGPGEAVAQPVRGPAILSTPGASAYLAPDWSLGTEPGGCVARRTGPGV